jgi:hypothetical protein
MCPVTARVHVKPPSGATSELDLAGRTDEEVAEDAEPLLGLA